MFSHWKCRPFKAYRDKYYYLWEEQVMKRFFRSTFTSFLHILMNLKLSKIVLLYVITFIKIHKILDFKIVATF